MFDDDFPKKKAKKLCKTLEKVQGDVDKLAKKLNSEGLKFNIFVSSPGEGDDEEFVQPCLMRTEMSDGGWMGLASGLVQNKRFLMAATIVTYLMAKGGVRASIKKKSRWEED